VLVRCIWVLLVLLTFGCASDPQSSGNPGPKAFGERCEATEECASLLCVRLDREGGVCSKTCGDAAGCPTADNWECLSADESTLRVCACLPLSSVEVCGNGLDDDCDGAVDDCRTCGGVEVPKDDQRNCGACGVACRNDQVCKDGACGCAEPLPDSCATCTDVSSDPLNCGACGTVCLLGQACINGSCGCPDASEPDYCPGTGCVSLAQNNANCGACDQACKLGQACSAGSCACTAAEAPNFCPEVGCVDLQTDEKSCGECGNACGPEQRCLAGECTCDAGVEACGTACVSLATSKKNCGECGNACPTAQACVQGECACVPGVTSVCGEGCADLANDVENCGKCGKVCAEGETCTAGKCTCASDVYCSDECMPVGDEENCGACGATCPSSQSCMLGACECTGFGLSKCGDTCKDLQYDAQNCGTCGKACAGDQYCSGGSCTCPYPGTFCEATGKCLDLGNDEANCGACGKACNATEVCSQSYCQCPGYQQVFCASANACVYTQTDVKNCGACGNACNPTEICFGGACRCSEAAGQFCASANACVNTWTSAAHCGGCDKSCPSETECYYGTCYCEAAGKSLCDDDKCYDLANDPKHCGGCDIDCGGAYECQGGACVCPTPSVGAAVRLTNNALTDTRVVAAWDGAHVGIAYLRQIAENDTYYNLRFALLNPDGTSSLDIPLTNYVAGDLSGAGSASPSTPSSPQDTLAITFNGTEFAVAYISRELGAGDKLRLIRVSKAGVPSAGVTLADGITFGGKRPGVAWSVPYAGYAVTASVTAKLWYRRVGADGTQMDPPNFFPISDSAQCDSTSIVAAPDGRWGVSCRYVSQGDFGIFNADGSRTLAPVKVDQSVYGSALETVWDGTTFATVYEKEARSIRLFRHGAASTFELAPYLQNDTYDGAEIVFMPGSLSLGYVINNTFKLKRFKLPTELTQSPTAIHDVVDMVPNANVIDKPELVSAGTSKLMAIWLDNRWGGAAELYAAPIDLKACP
jgi:hypothetical protein